MASVMSGSVQISPPLFSFSLKSRKPLAKSKEMKSWINREGYSYRGINSCLQCFPTLSLQNETLLEDGLMEVF